MRILNVRLTASAASVLSAALFFALSVAASGCAKDNSLEPENTQQNGDKITFQVKAPDGASSSSAESKVAYDDENLKVAWQTGDKLAALEYYSNGYCVAQVFRNFTYGGTDGATSGPFTGTPYSQSVAKYDFWYPSTISATFPNSGEPIITLDMSGQMQNGNNSTAHLKNFMIFYAKGVLSSEATFSMTMVSSIMKFIFTNVPEDVGKLKSISLAVQTDAGTRAQSLKFKDGSVVFDATHRTLTAYMSFNPNYITGPDANGKLKVMLSGDKDYVYEVISTDGKEYKSGRRYTATVNCSSNTTAKAFMSYTISLTSAKTMAVYLEDGTIPADIIIDWGDNSTPTAISKSEQISTANGGNGSHSYTKAGIYTVTITSAESDESGNPQINGFNFYNKTNLVSVDTPLLRSDATSFGNLFYSDENLTAAPGYLFEKNPQVTNFNCCFDGCEALTNIYSGLFDKNVDATDFGYCFNSCPLTSIPAELFDKNTEAVNFSNCFREGKFTSIPAGLFDNNTKAEDFSYCFRDCNYLVSIPSGLFDNNTEVTTFNDCFDRCGTSGSTVMSIPAGLFDHCTKVTTFEYCFREANLTSIPDSLFKYNTEVTTFANCFSGCSKITAIPNKMFDHNRKVTSFYQCFYAWTITSIPSALFNKNTKVTNFGDIFSSCNKLTSIPVHLFDMNTEVTSFSGCFSYCSDLASVPEGLFEKNTKCTNFSSCFIQCDVLKLNEKIFSTASNAPTNRFATTYSMNFGKCFREAGYNLSAGTQGKAPALWQYTVGSYASYGHEDCFKDAYFTNCSQNSPDYYSSSICTNWGTPKGWE